MLKKLNTVMLIDDDLTINYFHNRLIEKSNIANRITISKNGKDGYTTFCELNNQLQSGEIVLIFLDLNMPIMDGWGFLESLSKIKSDIKINYKIYILSSTINPDDIKKAKNNDLVSGFFNKPLAKENLEQLKSEYLN